MPTYPAPEPEIAWQPYGNNLPAGFKLSTYPGKGDNKQALIFTHGLGRNHANERQKDCNGIVNEIVSNGGSEKFNLYAIDYPSKKHPDFFQALRHWRSDPDLRTTANTITDILLQNLGEKSNFVLCGISQGSVVMRQVAANLNERQQFNPKLPGVTDVINITGPHDGVPSAAAFAWFKKQLRDLSPGSTFLQELKENPNAPSRSEMLHIISKSDEIVPRTSSLAIKARRVLEVDPLNRQAPNAIGSSESFQDPEKETPPPQKGGHVGIIDAGAPIARFIIENAGRSTKNRTSSDARSR